jgi:hypothetical protein
MTLKTNADATPEETYETVDGRTVPLGYDRLDEIEAAARFAWAEAKRIRGESAEFRKADPERYKRLRQLLERHQADGDALYGSLKHYRRTPERNAEIAQAAGQSRYRHYDDPTLAPTQVKFD